MAPEVTSLPMATEHQVSRWAGVYVCPEPASVSDSEDHLPKVSAVGVQGGWPMADPPETSRGVHKPAAFWARSSRPLRLPGLLTYTRRHVEC